MKKGNELSKPTSTPNTVAKKESQPEVQTIDLFEEELRKRLSNLLPSKGQDEIIRQIVSVTYREAFAGPIPHPRHLRDYEAICPGAADRLIAMAEAQQRHQVSTEEKLVAGEFSDRRLGLWLGAATFALLIGGAIYCGWHDKTAVAIALVSAATIGGVGLFVNGRSGSNDK